MGFQISTHSSRHITQHFLTYLSIVFIKNKQNWRVTTPKVLHLHISMKRACSIYLHLYTVIWQRLFRFSTSVHRLLTVIFQTTDFQSGISRLFKHTYSFYTRSKLSNFLPHHLPRFNYTLIDGYFQAY